jgi:hypothetical protein
MRYFPHFQRCLKPNEKGLETFSLLGKMERLQQADLVPCQNSLTLSRQHKQATVKPTLLWRSVSRGWLRLDLLEVAVETKQISSTVFDGSGFPGYA